MLSLIHQVAGRPWAIRADIAHHVRGLVAREGFGALRDLAGVRSAIHDPKIDERRAQAAAAIEARRGGGKASAGLVAVVPIIGVMTKRGDVVGSAFTRASDEVAAEVLAAALEPRVDAIVLEIDSPGGEVFGVPELWAAIREAARTKPVVASANAVAASAALYAASAATEVLVTPSGEIGSLGVYAMHVDESEAVKAEGVHVEFIVADESPHKVEGNPYEPLSEDARAQIKKSVNRFMGMFVRDVAKGRGVSPSHVRENFGGGRMLSPQEAVAVKMADRVGTFADAIARASELARERGTNSGTRAAGSLTPAQAAALQRVALL